MKTIQEIIAEDEKNSIKKKLLNAARKELKNAIEKDPDYMLKILEIREYPEELCQ